MPLSSLFVDQPGTCEEPKLAPDGLEHRKPKQMKSPTQAYIDLPLWKDGQRENPVEPESWEEGTPVSPAADTPQGTPPNSLSRSPQRKKTESALYGCTMLLASVALGLDIRELTKAQASEDPLPKEGRKKREGIFQRVPKSRRSASPATRLLAVGEGASSTPSLPLSTTANLLSVPSLSTRCLLHTDGEDSFESSTHISCAPRVPTPDPCPAFGGRVQKSTPTPGLETSRDGWRNLPPSFTELTCGGVSYAAASKERAASHRRTLSDGSAARPPAGAALISAPGASELPPEWVWGMPPSLSGPHSDLPSEVPPEKQRAVHMVPLPRPPPLRSRGGALQAFPSRTESQPSQAGPAVGGPGPAHSCPLGPKKRTQPRMPSLLDTDVEGQSRDRTVPLCRIRSRASRPSLYELEKEFLS